MVVNNVAGLKLLNFVNRDKYLLVDIEGGVLEWYLVNKLEDSFGFGFRIASGTDLSFNVMRL
jgi:hypothetical protein